MECESRRTEFELKLKEREHLHQKRIEKELSSIKEKEKEVEKQLKEGQEVERERKQLEKEKEKIELERKKLSSLKSSVSKELEKCASLSKEEAKALYMENIEAEMGKNLQLRKEELEKNFEQEATKVLTTAVGRLAHAFTAEATITSLALPNDEMKRRIIGREGRNIRLLEQLTGVNYLLDESPNAVVISSVDPIRRSIAKQALQKLIADGRIHATRIEEAVERAEKEVEKEGIKAAEHAALQLGVIDLHPELIALLGGLHFRHSLGQNLLDHSVEVAFLMKLIAAELHLDEEAATRMGFLHDIGKAAPPQLGRSHALVGYDLALKFHEKVEVANGIGAHHGEITPMSVEAHLLGAADAISGGRPGARRESIQRYIKRLEMMEILCMKHDEVEKAYALQAGREVRVIVKPERVDDDAAAALARTLVKKLEKELSFSGKIKVTVIREKKIVDYAS
ncbi:MAG: Ribonuclease Y [Chlamydiales bacterium]|nr:Ribonuclease Y [Chlamydiales bacterium]MCH9620087.1 Ribonuclease Y [Chlamydiales bacterium]MCH9623040.1 Ribonuclease Y [Chlamydiales bacterium]